MIEKYLDEKGISINKDLCLCLYLLPGTPLDNLEEDMLEIVSTGEIYEEVDRSIEYKTEMVEAGQTENHGVGLVTIRTPGIIFLISEHG